MAAEDPFRRLDQLAVWRPWGDVIAWELVARDAAATPLRLGIMRKAAPAYIAEVGSERWEIEETTRRFGYRVTVRIAETQQEVAAVTWPFHWLGTFRPAMLSMRASGRSFLWKRTRSGPPVWELHAPSGKPLLTFRDTGTSRGGAEVEVQPEARMYAELPLLLAVGWFLVETHSFVIQPPDSMFGAPP